jgi:[ribosomal protein S18]-alanine N-acetyltransferase
MTIISMTKIKPATEAEHEWAASLMTGTDPWIRLGTTWEQCLNACRHAEHLVFIAHDDDQPLGLIILHPHGVAGSPYIKSICVSEKARSRGVGASLVEFAENFFRKDSKHLFLCVSSFNTRAKLFYERMDYHQVGEFKDYIIPGESELLMHKTLK